MQPDSQSSDPLASVERHLVAIEHMLEHQTIALAQLRDELADAGRRNDWHHVQFSEMIRILARDMRELRTTLICSVVSDGPISAQVIQTLLRQTDEDAREFDLALQPKVKHRGN
jgi:predicted transcriptional regulator